MEQFLSFLRCVVVSQAKEHLPLCNSNFLWHLEIPWWVLIQKSTRFNPVKLIHFDSNTAGDGMGTDHAPSFSESLLIKY